MNLIGLITWYTIGFLSVIIGTYYLENQVTIKDIVASLFIAVFGPIATLIVLFAFYDTFQNKVLIKRRKK